MKTGDILRDGEKIGEFVERDGKLWQWDTVDPDGIAYSFIPYEDPNVTLVYNDAEPEPPGSRDLWLVMIDGFVRAEGSLAAAKDTRNTIQPSAPIWKVTLPTGEVKPPLRYDPEHGCDLRKLRQGDDTCPHGYSYSEGSTEASVERVP